jgi:hypothetical protein
MNLIPNRLSVLLVSCCLVLAAALLVPAQQRRTQPKPPPKPVASPTPSATFDTLIATDSYNIYGEVRGVGQVIRSNTINQLLEPVLNVAAPPKEFKTLIKWLNSHADEVMTSRMLFASWRTGAEVPDVLVAIEFPSAEEAAKFEPQLNSFLPKLLPPKADTPPETGEAPGKTKPAAEEKPKEPVPTKPSFYIKQMGSLVVVTSTPLNLKKLRPAGSKLLSDDPHFRASRNRFSSEPVFVFLDMKGFAKEDEERRKRYAEMEKQATAASEAAKTEIEEQKEEAVPVEPDKPDEPTNQLVVTEAPQTQTPNELAGALSLFGTALSGGEGKWPDAISLAISFDNESIDVRGLFLTEPGEKSDPIPILPILSAGPPLVPESPSILPADTEMFIVGSLDLPQIYASLSKAAPPGVYRESRGNVQTVKDIIPESPIAALERQLKINLRDELLPLLGSEVLVTLPVSEFGLGLGPMGGADMVQPAATPEPTPGGSGDNFTLTETVVNTKSPVLAFSVKDKEGMKRLVPKIVESIGFKGASALANTERREDTELVSYANAFAYAFIGNFMVVSTDAKSVRHWVDSYLKHDTLTSSMAFKNFTRWQPRQVQGMAYISPSLMQMYKAMGSNRASVNQQAKEIFDRLGLNPQPITYALSNEGLGAFHELHLPKDLILMLVAGVSTEVNPPEDIANERAALGALHSLVFAQKAFKEKKGQGYGSLDQLIAEFEWIKIGLDNSKYRFEVIASGDKFEMTAVPNEYGKSGKMSYFVNETGVVRGADHGGGPATVADKPVSPY